MSVNTDSMIRNILDRVSRIGYVKPEDIPNIDLYMDQVTTFMEAQLAHSKRYEDDKILTKTMINNYAKNNLLPSPVKKKYSKDHMLMLVFIYYFKNLLSFSDIEELFRPITSKHFSGQTSQLSLEDIYNEVFTLEKGEMDNLKSDVAAKFARAQDTFSDAPVDDKDREYLKLFAFICELSFDVYLKTQMIEMIADQLREDAPAPRKK